METALCKEAKVVSVSWTKCSALLTEVIEFSLEDQVQEIRSKPLNNLALDLLGCQLNVLTATPDTDLRNFTQVRQWPEAYFNVNDRLLRRHFGDAMVVSIMQRGDEDTLRETNDFMTPSMQKNFDGQG